MKTEKEIKQKSIKEEKVKSNPLNTNIDDTSKESFVNSLMDIYFENYPEENIFYRTTDGQVFLSKNKNDAIAHQKRLGNGELEIIKKQ